MDNKRFHDIILDNLKNDVTSNYVLLGVPRHMNLGDTLIWEAERQFLDKLQYKRLNTFFWGVKASEINITDNDIIIFSGGGSWDDIWNTIDYIEYILQSFSNNKFIFLPNSVWYNNIKRIEKTKDVLQKHIGEVILYNREQQSYDIAKKHFYFITNKLIPDIVMGWDIEEFLMKYDDYLTKDKLNYILYISRNDLEKTNVKNFSYDVKQDWPTIVKTPNYVNGNISCIDWENNIKDKLIIESINFINRYKIIYSHRMHGGILAWLLDKETYLINNSYGKTKSLYDTWFKDIDNIKMFE